MPAGGASAEVRDLEARLRRPERGERGFVAGSERLTRLEALARLHALAGARKVERRGREGGINTHVHTSKSFAFFASPAEAVWCAYLERLAVLGINDHYTLAGHEEFGAACAVVGIRPMFSMEAVALWEEAEREGKTVNDPANPGRTYLTAKGITRPFPPGSRGEEDLRRMNAALERRNREMTGRAAAHFERRLEIRGAPSWEDVLALTPHGEPTERHIAEAAARLLEERFPELGARRAAASRLLAVDVRPEALAQAGSFQDLIRARLLKVGCPAYVAESTDAFVPIERLVSMARDLGALPTYPVLGTPVTPWEEDLETLYERLEALGIRAIELIPDRNERPRLRDIVARAAARGFLVVSGTEHNTKSPAPLVDRFFFDPEFHAVFEAGALAVLEHQEAGRRGRAAGGR
jgi:hypothetical protein